MLCNDIHTALAPMLERYEQVCVVKDEGIHSFTPSLFHSFTPSPLCTLSLCTSEQTKSLETVERIWDFLFEQGMTRRGLLVAVGGGVLTDLAGFAAATYKRGIDYVTVPTTLLSMVDASSGGKTGFNYHGLKNSIGVFAPPVETIIWPGWLNTLPADQFLSGFAEMLKTGLVEKKGRESLWNRLLQYDLDRMPLENTPLHLHSLTPLIEACVRAKETIVTADPHEEGLRKVLNFGHTFGHALEEIQMVNGTSSNGKWLHGYAVLYGLIAELYLSVTKLGCPKEPLQQLTQLMLHYYGRPQCKCSDRSQLIALMRQDKKNERAAQINCTLIRDIGQPVINQVITPDEANEALEYLFSL